MRSARIRMVCPLRSVPLSKRVPCGRSMPGMIYSPCSVAIDLADMSLAWALGPPKDGGDSASRRMRFGRRARLACDDGSCFVSKRQWIVEYNLPFFVLLIYLSAARGPDNLMYRSDAFPSSAQLFFLMAMF